LSYVKKKKNRRDTGGKNEKADTWWPREWGVKNKKKKKPAKRSGAGYPFIKRDGSKGGKKKKQPAKGAKGMKGKQVCRKTQANKKKG